MTTPKPPKPTKAKHPFPKAYFATSAQSRIGIGHDDDCFPPEHLTHTEACAARPSAQYVAEYTLTRVLKVNRGVTFEEVK